MRWQAFFRRWGGFIEIVGWYLCDLINGKVVSYAGCEFGLLNPKQLFVIIQFMVAQFPISSTLNLLCG
jgi:hypothetical protein